MGWDTFWAGLLQLLGTLFALSAAATVAAKDRGKWPRLFAALLGLIELAVGSFVALASLAPSLVLKIGIPLFVGGAGLLAVRAQRAMYREMRRAGVALDPFDKEQAGIGSRISMVTYSAVILTAFLVDSDAPWYWIRSVPTCWLAISGTWEMVAYFGNFTTLLNPRGDDST